MEKKFRRYTDMNQEELSRLKPSYDSRGIPLRIVHPVRADRSKRLDFHHSEAGIDGITYLFFEPVEKVSGMPWAPCGRHLRTAGEQFGHHVPFVILRADRLVVDLEQRELRIDSALAPPLQNEPVKTA